MSAKTNGLAGLRQIKGFKEYVDVDYDFSSELWLYNIREYEDTYN